jgi:N-formylglutamate amidohydrolase
MIEKYGVRGCALIDFHGFGTGAKLPWGECDLVLGTAYRKTVKSDIDQALTEFMTERGYKVFLPGPKPVGDLWDHFDGGFITRHYAATYGLDTVQIECAKHFRTSATRAEGEKLSSDLAAFFKIYFGL